MYTSCCTATLPFKKLSEKKLTQTYFFFVYQLKQQPGKTTFQIKISADGAKMTRLSNFVIVSHSLLDKSGETAMSAQGKCNFTLHICSFV